MRNDELEEMTHKLSPEGSLKIIQMKKMRKSFPDLSPTGGKTLRDVSGQGRALTDSGETPATFPNSSTLCK